MRGITVRAGWMQIVWRSLIAAALVSSSVNAAADDAAAIKYRQKVMDSVGGTMGAMSAIAKQEVTHPEHLAPLAHNMANLTTIVPDVFPAGSGKGDTKALPEIWSKPDAFKERVTAFVDAANKLDDVVKAGDMTAFPAVLGTLGKACKGCHDDFKKE
jgi:cytochrome c556